MGDDDLIRRADAISAMEATAVRQHDDCWGRAVNAIAALPAVAAPGVRVNERALEACRIIDEVVKEGHDTVGEMILHFLTAAEPARKALALAALDTPAPAQPEKGGDAFAEDRNPNRPSPATSPGVTAGATPALMDELVEALRAFKAFDDLPTAAKRPDVFEQRVRQPILAVLAKIGGAA